MAAGVLGSVWRDWLKADGSSWPGSSSPCEQNSRLTRFVLGSPVNPAWHLKGTTSQASLNSDLGSQAGLCVILERVMDAWASPDTGLCRQRGQPSCVLQPPRRAFTGCCTSLTTCLELQARIVPLCPPSVGLLPHCHCLHPVLSVPVYPQQRGLYKLLLLQFQPISRSPVPARLFPSDRFV